MTTKIFGGEKITIREFSKGDLRNAKKFQDFINSLVEEDAQILLDKKVSLREESIWLKMRLNDVKNKRKIYLVAENKNMIVGTVEIGPGIGRNRYVGTIHIAIRNGYRGMGLGNYLIRLIIKLGKERFRLEILKIPVFATNKPAVGLYEYCGFRKVARIPKQFLYKGKMVDEFVMQKYL